MDAIFAMVLIGLPARSDFDVDAFIEWVRRCRLRPVVLEDGHLVTLSGSALLKVRGSRGRMIANET